MLNIFYSPFSTQYIDYPNRRGRANSERGISEGDTKFLYTMKLVPLRDLESNVHLNIIHRNTIH